jgi:hypothetical protein
VPKDRLEQQDLQERKVIRGYKEVRVALGYQVHRDSKETLERKVLRELKAHRAIRV